MIYRIQYFIAKLCLLIVRILPTSVCNFLARRVGDLAYLFMFKRRRVGHENAARAFGMLIPKAKQRRHVRQSFQNVSLSIFDLFNVPKIRKNAQSLFTLKGLSNHRRAYGRGKGVLLVISHLGSWENLAFLPYLTNTTSSVVVKDIKNPYINEMVNRARLETGLIPIPKVDSIRPMMKRLKNNEMIAILIDQWAGPEGIWTSFFGEPTSTTSIPARLALKTGCTLMPAFCIREPKGKFTIDLHKPIFIDELDAKHRSEAGITKILNQILESKILAFPGQWAWGHRRWKPKPSMLREA